MHFIHSSDVCIAYICFCVYLYVCVIVLLINN